MIKELAIALNKYQSTTNLRIKNYEDYRNKNEDNISRTKNCIWQIKKQTIESKML